MEDTTTPIHMDGTARGKLMKLLPPVLILMLTLTAGVSYKLFQN